MSQTAPALWLVTYDIADQRRLMRVFKFMRKRGVPIQYSVFQVEASTLQMGQLMAELAHIVHAKQDDVRAYRLPERGWTHVFGRSMLPEGILPGAALPQRSR